MLTCIIYVLVEAHIQKWAKLHGVEARGEGGGRGREGGGRRIVPGGGGGVNMHNLHVS